MAALHSEHKAVHLSRLSLQPYLPSDATGSHCRRSGAREAKTGVLGIPESLNFGDTPSNSRLHRTIAAGILCQELVGGVRRWTALLSL